MICTLCETAVPDGRVTCTNCGSFAGANIQSGIVGDGTVLLSEVVSAEFDRIDIGPWNYVWGGGLVRKSTTLLGGMPGAGKSTMLIQMCELLTAQIPDKEVIYIASEEDLEPIKARAERLNLQNMGRIRMLETKTGITNVGDVLHARKPGAAILDSMQGLFGNDANDCNDALDVLKKFSSVLNAPVIIVSQVTKDGDYAGQMSFQHHVDCLMFLMPEETEETEGSEAERVLSVRKNRNGRAFIDTRFAMRETGLIALDGEDGED